MEPDYINSDYINNDMRTLVIVGSRMLLFVACAGWLLCQPAFSQTRAVSIDGYRDAVWDAARSRFFISTGSNILMIDPETAQIEDTIATGGVANRIAVSDDGQFLYAAVGERSVITRYNVERRVFDLEIPLTRPNSSAKLTAAAMVVLPGNPESLLVARSTWPMFSTYPLPIYDLVLYDGAIQRGAPLPLTILALYVDPSDGSIHGVGDSLIHRFLVSGEGAAVDRTTPVPPGFESIVPLWGGHFLMDRKGMAFDLEKGEWVGRAVAPEFGWFLGMDAAGTSILAAEVIYASADSRVRFVRSSLGTLRITARAEVPGMPFMTEAVAARSWGADGMMLIGSTQSSGMQLISFHISGFVPAASAPPEPEAASGGSIRVPVPARDVAYDAKRNLVWATIPGKGGAVANSLVSIEPETGRIVDVLYAGNEPGKLALSTDGNRLFTSSTTTPTVSVFDLNAKQRVTTFSVSDGDYKVAYDVAAIPDQNDSVVVVRRAPAYGSPTEIAVYDGPTPRPNAVDSLSAGATGARTYATALYPADAPNAFYAINLESPSNGGPHDVARVVVEPDGVRVEARLRPLETGSFRYGGGVLLDGARLYTGAGVIATPDTQRLEGRVDIQYNAAFGGVPVAFPERNQVVYATTVSATEATVRAFDLTTLVPTASLALDKNTLLMPATVAATRAGSDRIAIAREDAILLVPLHALSPWPKPSSTLKRVAPGVTSIDLKANGIAALPGTGKVVASTPSAMGSLGNSVVTIDPATGKVESAVYVGSEPSALAPALDGSTVSVVLNGEWRIARVDLASKMRDRLFVANPTGGSEQLAIYDMVTAPDGGLTVSYFGGPIAMFDDESPRPEVEWNTEGSGAYSAATFRLAFSSSGSTLYAYNGYLSTFEFKRVSVTPRGLKWMSTAAGLISGYGNAIWQAGGLIYTADGYAIDPERSRKVGRFAFPDPQFQAAGAWPDEAAGRVYYLGRSYSRQQFAIAVFDLKTYEFLGSLPLPIGDPARTGATWTRYGEQGFAVSTGAAIFFVDVAAIPLLAAPVASPPLPPLPSTEGVSVIDLAAADVVYDTTRDVLWASIPNREAALGDRIAAIDPATGEIRQSYPAGLGPRRIALSSDGGQLYFTSGSVSNTLGGGHSPASESIRTLDVAAGTIGEGFGYFPPTATRSYAISDLAVLSGTPAAVVAIHARDDLLTLSDGSLMRDGPFGDSIRVYDAGTQRPAFVSGTTFDCTALAPGPLASRLYCASATRYAALTVDASGVTQSERRTLTFGNGYDHVAYADGKLFTATGLVLDAESGKTLAKLNVDGAVTVNGQRVYWLNAGYVFGSAVTLYSFDLASLQPIDTMLINVSKADVTRLVPAGKGRVAFRCGNEIYIVTPRD